MELDELSIEILGLLVFEESFVHICEECSIKDKNIVSDVLRVLIVRDLVRVFEERDGKLVAVNYVEPDEYKNQFFRISAKGLKTISL